MSQPEKFLSVFLMYSSPDRAIVETIYSNLTGIGVSPWMDIKKLSPGLDWTKEIMLALRDSNLVLIFFSNSSNSRPSFFQKEIKYAFELAEEMPEDEIFIIPIRLDDCHVPKSLQRYQFVDFSDSKDKGWNSLFQVIIHKQKKMGLSISPKNDLALSDKPKEDSVTENKISQNEAKLKKTPLDFFSKAKVTTDIFSNIYHIVDDFISTQSGNTEKIAASQIKLLTSYYSLVLNQAQRSFTWALIWAFIGVLSFIASGVFLLVNHLNEIAYISVIGGAIIEIISGINFYLYNKSSSQLAEFHTRLDATQRILLANTICEKIEGDLKQETRSQLALAFAGVKLQTTIIPKEHVIPIIRISKINFNPEGKDLENEFIEISNFGNEPVDITEWKLSDKVDHEFTFPRFFLHPRQSVIVWTKIGKDSEKDLFWNKGVPVWNNMQDCAYLKTNEGVLIDFYCYSSNQKAG